jgi:hypothetical protein
MADTRIVYYAMAGTIALMAAGGAYLDPRFARALPVLFASLMFFLALAPGRDR